MAALVAQGLTNRQIAAELVVSVCTAEKHVEPILAKLGLGTCGPAASAAAHGLAAPSPS